jgi:RNA polymerase sigma-70 factor (ECF subfamily)
VQDSVWDERELVRRCKEGSEAAYAELVHQHGARLVTLAYRLTGSRETAEDVVQETFLAAFRGMERFTPRPSLAAWITTICVRLAGRAGQRRAATRAASLDQLAELGSPVEVDGLFGEASGHGRDPQAAAEASELRQVLIAAIAALPYKQRAAVVLRFVSGLDYAEAAQALDVPLNTYKSHLQRGTRQLRDALLPLAQRSGGERAGQDLHTGRPDDGQPIDRGSSTAVPVIDDQFVAGSLSTRPERAISVAAVSRRATGSTPIADDSSP